MDPDAALAACRTIAARVLAVADTMQAPDPQDAVALAEHFQALDEWLGREGAPPRAWYAKRRIE